MSYRIAKLAPGAYDVFLGEEVVASLVRDGERSRLWTVELLQDLPAGKRPAPFTKVKHRFGSLDQACAWLGAEVAVQGVRLNPSRQTQEP